MGAKVTPDYEKNINYLQPTLEPANIDGVSACADLVVGFEEDRIDASNQYIVYALGNTGHFYKLVGAATTQISAAAPWPYHISADSGGNNGVIGHDLTTYYIGTTPYIFYSWDNATSGSVGTFDLANTFRDQYVTLSAATPGMLSAGSPHPMVVGDDNILYIGNGNKLVSFDGQTGTDGTYDGVALDFPNNIQLTSIFKVGDYLGITGWEKTGTTWVGTSSYVYLWDYVADSWNKVIPIRTPKISTAFNLDGDVYIFCEDKKWSSIRKLTDTGSQLVARLIYNNSAIDSAYVYPPRKNAVKYFENKMLIGCDKGYGCVFEYGKSLEGLPASLILKHILSGTSIGIGAIGTPYNIKVLYSHYDDDSSKYLIKSTGIGFGTTRATDAYWAGLYTDFGQKVRINYIKYYFKPLASGDIATPKVSLDYSSDIGLVANDASTTMSYTGDGAIASKRFNLKKDCYSISPRMLFGGGNIRIQKIEIDYQPISNT
jgi:hypothetical protein